MNNMCFRLVLFLVVLAQRKESRFLHFIPKKMYIKKAGCHKSLSCLS